MALFTAGQKVRASALNDVLDTGTYAQYNASATQTITTGTQPLVAFGTANVTSASVTRSVSGAGHKFTFNKAGVWGITCCIRFASAATNERYVLLNSNNGGLCSAGQILSGTGPYTVSPSATQYFNSGDSVWVEAYQNSGGNRDLEFSNTVGWGRINMVWLHS